MLRLDGGLEVTGTGQKAGPGLTWAPWTVIGPAADRVIS